MNSFELSQQIVPPRTDVISDEIIVRTSEAFVKATTTGGDLVINGTNIGATTKSVPNGTRVAVALRSWSTPASTQFVTLKVGDQTMVIALTTDEGGSTVFDESDPSSPLDFNAIAQRQGIDFTPVIEPYIQRMYTNGNKGSLVCDMRSSPTGGEVVDGGDNILIADSYANCLYRTDARTGEYVEKIALPGSPLSVAVAKEYLNGKLGYFFYVAMSDGSILCLSGEDFSVVETINLGDSANYFVAAEENIFWALCNSSIRKISVGQDLVRTEEVFSLPANANPLRGIQVGNDLYATLFETGQLVRVRNGAVEFFDVGPRPFGLTYSAYRGSWVFVSCADKIYYLDSSADTMYSRSSAVSGRVTDMYNYGATLFFIVPDSKTVVSVNSSIFRDRNTDYGFEYISFNTTPIDLHAVAGETNTVRVLVNVPNAPSQRIPFDPDPDTLSFEAMFDTDLSKPIVSDTITVAGINSGTRASVYPEGSLIVNGVNVGSNTTVYDGDTLAVELNSPDTYSTFHETAVALGFKVAKFRIRTVGADNIPDSIVFNNVIGVEPSSVHVSNPVTISGMKDGTSILASAVNATLIVNGASVSSAQLQNGDTVALSVTAADFGLSSIGVLTVGPIQATFSVQTRTDPAGQCTDLASLLAFQDIENALINSVQESNVVTIAGLDGPTVLSLAGVYSAEFIYNNAAYGREITVRNGDTVSVRMQVSAGFDLDHVLTVNSCGGTVSWTVKSEPDVTPYYMEFNEVYDGFINQMYASNEVTVEGMTEGAVGTATVEPECKVTVNGVVLNDKEDYFPDQSFQFSLKNGDTVILSGYPGRPYGSVAAYTLSIGLLETDYRVFSRALDGAYENPVNRYFDFAEAHAFSRSFNRSVERRLDPKVRHGAYRSSSSMVAAALRPSRPESVRQQAIALRVSRPDGGSRSPEVTQRTNVSQSLLPVRSNDSPVMEFGQSSPEVKITLRHNVDVLKAFLGSRSSFVASPNSFVRYMSPDKLTESLDFLEYVTSNRQMDSLEFNETQKTTHYFEKKLRLPVHSPFEFRTVDQYDFHKTDNTDKPVDATFGKWLRPLSAPATNTWYSSPSSFRTVVWNSWIRHSIEARLFFFDWLRERHLRYEIDAPGFLRNILTGRKASEVHGFDFVMTPVSISFYRPAHRSSIDPTSPFNAAPELKTAGNKHGFEGKSALYSKRTVEEIDVAPEAPVSPSTFEVATNAAPKTVETRTFDGLSPSADHFILHEDPDHIVVTPDMLMYFDSEQSALDAAIDAGVEPSRAQAFELYAGCWVWSEILDQPDLCEVPEPDADSGWIKGG